MLAFPVTEFRFMATQSPRTLEIRCVWCDARFCGSKSGWRVKRHLQQFVYARHGRDLMGCKSPVCKPCYCRDDRNINTSRKQGRSREGSFGGSWSTKLWADEQKWHTRPSLWVSQHLYPMLSGVQHDKAPGLGDTVNAAVV